jgi:phosphatidylserine/phosphatidylglycerophosphate/cardiolipin synthase-like enzyme
VHHNFVQRWNEASERLEPGGLWPDARTAGDLPFPTVLSPPAGDVPVQITRTVRAGCYRQMVAAPETPPHAVAEGEASVVEQYLAALDAATRSIYCENQFLLSPEFLMRLEAALERGVDVVFLLPINPMQEVRNGRRDPRYAPYFDRLGQLRAHERFTMAGLVAADGGGARQDVYVHAKLALVDDAWATIGSANIATRSFYGDTELNASLWHAPTVRSLRGELLREHLGTETDGLDDRAALRLFRDIAQANRARHARGEPLQGLAVAIDPADYAG